MSNPANKQTKQWMQANVLGWGINPMYNIVPTMNNYSWLNTDHSAVVQTLRYSYNSLKHLWRDAKVFWKTANQVSQDGHESNQTLDTGIL